jgi:hypothetical protein
MNSNELSKLLTSVYQDSRLKEGDIQCNRHAVKETQAELIEKVKVKSVGLELYDDDLSFAFTEQDNCDSVSPPQLCSQRHIEGPHNQISPDLQLRTLQPLKMISVNHLK